MPESDAEIIRKMTEYMQNFLEKSHPVFGELPVCPFAQSARLRQKILYQVYPFNNAIDLNSNSKLMQLVQQFSQSTRYDALWVIHPEPLVMPLSALRQFVEELNDQIAAIGLIAFSGHPHESFNIQGVYTRQEPYINFTVQTLTKVKAASDLLLKTRYYENWSLADLQQIGLPRSND